MKKNSSNFQQALWLGIGQFSSFAIAFLTVPILARYFDKVEYGTYKQILYVYSSLQALFTMGLPSVFAYFIPRLHAGQQKLLINRLTKLFVLLGALFSLVLFLSAGLIADLLKNPELSMGIRLFSPFPLFTLPTMGVEGIYTALCRTKEIAFYQIFSRAVMFLCIITPVVVCHAGYREAIIGWGIASFFTFIAAMYMKRSPYKNTVEEMIPDMYKQVLGYSLPLTGAMIAGFFVNSADQFFISRYYGTQAFAEFSNGSLSIPIIGMVAGSVQGVLLPLFSKANTEHNIPSAVLSYNNAVMKMAVIVMPILYFCLFFAEDVIVALFGEQYQGSKDYLQVHIIRDFIQILPYFAVLMALGYSKFYMNMHIVGAVIIWITDFIIVSSMSSVLLIVVVSSIFQVLCRVVSLMYISEKTKISFISRNLIGFIVKLSLHCCFFLVLLFIIRSTIGSQVSAWVWVVTSCILFYVMIILTEKLVNINYLESIQMLIKSRK